MERGTLAGERSGNPPASRAPLAGTEKGGPNAGGPLQGAPSGLPELKVVGQNVRVVEGEGGRQVLLPEQAGLGSVIPPRRRSLGA